MTFRYLIYRTDYGNTIVRESAVNDSTGNEAALFTDFVIPVNQPLYLWRVSLPSDVIPNTETNINNWLNFINPPSPDSPLDYQTFTGYTATTQIEFSNVNNDIDYLSGQTAGKLDKVFGAITGNVPIFGASGTTLIDSGYDINDLLTGISGATSIEVFTAYTATTNIKISAIEDNINYLSGETAARLKISNFNAYSAATKTYIDSISAGLDPKESVRVATVSDLTGAVYIVTGGTAGTGAFTSAPTSIDGVTLVNGDRVLVKNQLSPQQNGIYVVISSGVWYRSADMDGIPSNEISGGVFVFVETGNTNGSSGWVIDWDGIVNINIDPINWVQFSAANSYTFGVGINISGNLISLDGAAIAGDNLDWDGSQLNVEVTGGTLGVVLNSKVDELLFNSYTATTEIRLGGIEDDITYISGITNTKLNNLDFNVYTASTDTRLDNIESDIAYISGITSGLDNTKLSINVFTGYTATTKSDEIYLIRTGTTGIDINTITPTPIVWNGQLKSSTLFSWTGGSGIFVNQTGDYEITYNIPIIHTGNNNVRSYGSNIVINNTTVINRTFAAENTSRADSVGNLALPSVVVSLTSGTRLDLVVFRAGLAGTTNTRPNPTILIKKKNTLQ